MASVVNRHYQEYDVYIGRGTLLGNPFKVVDGLCSREEAIELFRRYLWRKIKNGTITLDYLRSLDGKRLACSCAPKACHGDVIVKAIKWAKEQP